MRTEPRHDRVGGIGLLSTRTLTVGGNARHDYTDSARAGRRDRAPAVAHARRIRRIILSRPPTRLLATIPNDTATAYIDEANDSTPEQSNDPDGEHDGERSARRRTIKRCRSRGSRSARRMSRRGDLYRTGAAPFKLVDHDREQHRDDLHATRTAHEQRSASAAGGEHGLRESGDASRSPWARRRVTHRQSLSHGRGQAALKNPARLIADNTTTVIVDSLPDASLGAAAAPVDTSGLTQPTGQVPAGATVIIVAKRPPFADAGGWAVIGNGEQAIRYTGENRHEPDGDSRDGPRRDRRGDCLQLHDHRGAGARRRHRAWSRGHPEGAPIHVWVQRDDLAAQAYMSRSTATGDGVYEHIVERRAAIGGVAAAGVRRAIALYSRPLVTVTYAARDLKTKSGKTVTIALASPAIAESLTIQDVAITEIGIRGPRAEIHRDGEHGAALVRGDVADADPEGGGVMAIDRGPWNALVDDDGVQPRRLDLEQGRDQDRAAGSDRGGVWRVDADPVSRGELSGPGGDHERPGAAESVCGDP